MGFCLFKSDFGKIGKIGQPHPYTTARLIFLVRQANLGQVVRWGLAHGTQKFWQKTFWGSFIFLRFSKLIWPKNHASERVKELFCLQYFHNFPYSLLTFVLTIEGLWSRRCSRVAAMSISFAPKRRRRNTYTTTQLRSTFSLVVQSPLSQTQRKGNDFCALASSSPSRSICFGHQLCKRVTWPTHPLHLILGTLWIAGMEWEGK